MSRPMPECKLSVFHRHLASAGTAGCHGQARLARAMRPAQRELRAPGERFSSSGGRGSCRARGRLHLGSAGALPSHRQKPPPRPKATSCGRGAAKVASHGREPVEPVRHRKTKPQRGDGMLPRPKRGPGIVATGGVPARRGGTRGCRAPQKPIRSGTCGTGVSPVTRGYLRGPPGECAAKPKRQGTRYGPRLRPTPASPATPPGPAALLSVRLHAQPLLTTAAARVSMAPSSLRYPRRLPNLSGKASRRAQAIRMWYRRRSPGESLNRRGTDQSVWRASC
jgi:hypothetical protein